MLSGYIPPDPRSGPLAEKAMLQEVHSPATRHDQQRRRPGPDRDEGLRHKPPMELCASASAEIVVIINAKADTARRNSGMGDLRIGRPRHDRQQRMRPAGK
jgi:hypothetical protein